MPDAAQLNPPWEFYEHLRGNAPVQEVPELGAYLVTRFEDVHRILMDPKTFSSEMEFGTGLSFTPSTPEKEAVMARGGYRWVPTLGFTDPPVHRRVRGVVQRTFSPRRIRQLEGLVQELCDEIVAGLDPSGVIDYAEEVALQLPVMVIGETLGVERADRARFNRWADAVMRRLGEEVTEEEDLALLEEYVDAELYFADQIAKRREQRRDDYLSDLVYAQQEDEDPITDEELMSIISFLPVAGSRTTAGLIGMTMHFLLEHPEAMSRVRTDPEYLDALIEETARMQSPAQAWFRRTTKEVEVAGVTIPENSRLLVLFGSANRDETKFECPNECRPDRDNVKEHVAFGWGPHFCPGAFLARTETRIATRTFLARFPEPRIAPGQEAVYHPNLVHRMVDHLPVCPE